MCITLYVAYSYSKKDWKKFWSDENSWHRSHVDKQAYEQAKHKEVRGMIFLVVYQKMHMEKFLFP